VSREFILFGVQFPMLLPLFFAGIALLLLFNALFGRLGFYRQVWHPALVRLCIFVAIFGGSIAWLYRT
jgi:ABC-type sulfate transport system permease component